jgi:thiol-disulfide isomerase/thioredoxin
MPLFEGDVMTSLALALILAAATTASEPTTTRPSSDSPTEIEQVVDRALKQYETARSYEDTLVVLSDIQATPPLEAPEPAEATLAFVRPGKLAMKNSLYRVIADGEKLWEAVDVWMQYSETAAPKVLKVGDLTLSRFGFFRDGRHPLLSLLLDGDRAALDVLSEKARLTEMKPDALDGVSGKRVSGTMGPGVAIEIWFDDATGLIGEIVYDHTKAAQVSAPGMNISKVVQRLSFKNRRMNEPIAEDRFAFTPDSHIDKVAVLRMPSSQELQQRLAGKPAPSFSGKYLDGRTASADDFKGRVLLLNFWSLNCGPCIMSMPIVQKVTEKYADKPVSVIGVNLDGPPAASHVVEMIRNQKVSYRQLIETKPSLAEKYFVEGIPCMVLVDGKGTIQSVRLGMADERDLSSKIDKLLKGENLFGK